MSYCIQNEWPMTYRSHSHRLSNLMDCNLAAHSAWILLNICFHFIESLQTSKWQKHPVKQWQSVVLNDQSRVEIILTQLSVYGTDQHRREQNTQTNKINRPLKVVINYFVLIILLELLYFHGHQFDHLQQPLTIRQKKQKMTLAVWVLQFAGGDRCLFTGLIMSAAVPSRSHCGPPVHLLSLVSPAPGTRHGVKGFNTNLRLLI